MGMKNEDFKGIYKNMINLFGEEITIKLYENYKGQQITFPMRLYSKKYVLKIINEKYNGKKFKRVIKRVRLF